jgi:hypothetical protein
VGYCQAARVLDRHPRARRRGRASVRIRRNRRHRASRFAPCSTTPAASAPPSV